MVQFYHIPQVWGWLGNLSIELVSKWLNFCLPQRGEESGNHFVFHSDTILMSIFFKVNCFIIFLIGGFFLEAGSNDAESFSDSLHFELNRGWTVRSTKNEYKKWFVFVATGSKGTVAWYGFFAHCILSMKERNDLNFCSCCANIYWVRARFNSFSA